MSKAYDRALDFLNRAIPLPPEVEVCCRGCGIVDKMVELDEAGDESKRGEFPYVCRGCGARYTIDGYTRGEPKRNPNPWVDQPGVLTEVTGQVTPLAPEQEAVLRHWYG